VRGSHSKYGVDDLDSRHVRRGEQEARGEAASKQVRREKVSCWMPTSPDCCSMMMMMMMTAMVLDVT
jgi:hypothetical protein